MSLSTAQLQQYRTQGYTTVPGFFTPDETLAMQTELARLRSAGAFRNVSTDGDGKTHSRKAENLQICPLSPHSPLFQALPFAQKVISLIPELIGHDVVLHLDQVFLKPAHHGSGTSWHQDNAYFRLDDTTLGVGMWIAVNEATAANGTMHVIPGMFKEELPHSRDPMSDHHVRCHPPEDKAVAIELPAGGVLLFNYGVPHCTKANTTGRDRAGVAFHFLNRQAMQRAKGNTPMGVILTGPHATAGHREYGITITPDTWTTQVQQTAGQTLTATPVGNQPLTLRA